MSESKLQLPKTGVAGLIENFRYDVLAGFLVFVIALPLCLAIAAASGFPPIAGILTAVIGGLVAPLISNSEMTIKGPAAGMIAIVVGAMGAFGYTGGTSIPADREAYQLVLAVGVISGIIQILFGVFRSGILGEFFPLAAVHGLLASIGIIIASSQVHVLVGVKNHSSEAWERIAEIPHSLANMSPVVAGIGGLCLVIMFGWPQLIKRLKFLKPVPSQAVVLAVAIPLGMYFQIREQPIFISTFGEKEAAKTDATSKPSGSAHPEIKSESSALALLHSIVGSQGHYRSAQDADIRELSDDEVKAEQDRIAGLSEAERKKAQAALDNRKKERQKVVSRLLVPLPENPTEAIVFPTLFRPARQASADTDEESAPSKSLDEDAALKLLPQSVFTMTGLYWIVMFSLVGTLESMLSAKAVDLIDPWKRKTNLNRDILAVGLANTLAAALGGLPNISEIVRSSANINNGARTRLANVFHGVFLLVFVLTMGSFIRMIPMTALAAMLIFTGYRLASPLEFVKTYKIGREQLVIFVTTIVAVLATDLLKGIACGVAMKFLIHFINGVPLRSIFLPKVQVEHRPDNTVVVLVRDAVVFSNWIFFKGKIEQVGIKDHKNVLLDLSDTRLVDHSVMEKLHELKEDFEAQGLHLEVIGLENHVKFSQHPDSARRR